MANKLTHLGYKYHYTYRITNIVEKKYYYGVHSCNCLPKEDIGVEYFSSSKNKAFKEDIKENPQNYKYKVVKIFSTRIEAVEHEIFLHNKFNVGVNKKFYNGTKQGSTNRDTTGQLTVMSVETNTKIMIPVEEYHENPNKYIFHRKNMVPALNLETNIKENISSEHYEKNKDIYTYHTRGRVNCINKDTNAKENISSEYYQKNKDIYKPVTDDGKITVKDILTNIDVRVTYSEYHTNKEKYTHHSSQKTNAKLEDGTIKRITLEEFYSSKKYSGINKGFVFVGGIKYSKEEFEKIKNTNGIKHQYKGMLNVRDKETDVIFKINIEDFDENIHKHVTAGYRSVFDLIDKKYKQVKEQTKFQIGVALKEIYIQDNLQYKKISIYDFCEHYIIVKIYKIITVENNEYLFETKEDYNKFLKIIINHNSKGYIFIKNLNIPFEELSNLNKGKYKKFKNLKEDIECTQYLVL